MSQYQNIPQAGDQRNVSQGNILENFQYLCTAAAGAPAGVANGILPVDHQASGNNVANPRDGFHNQCSYVAQTTPASLVNAINGQTSNGIEYVRLDSNSNGQLRFINNRMDAPVSYLLASINFDSAATPIGTPFNCSVVRNSVGRFTVSFITAPVNTNYLIICTCGPASPGASPVYPNYDTKAAGSFRIRFFYPIGATFLDPDEASVMVYGFY